MNTLITDDLINAAKTAGCCKMALHWLTKRPRSVEELAVEHPTWVLWACRYLPEYAVPLLTPETLAACAEAEPWVALRHCAHLLTPETLAACAEAEPWVALAYCAHLLTPETLATSPGPPSSTPRLC